MERGHEPRLENFPLFVFLVVKPIKTTRSFALYKPLGSSRVQLNYYSQSLQPLKTIHFLWCNGKVSQSHNIIDCDGDH